MTCFFEVNMNGVAFKVVNISDFRISVAAILQGHIIGGRKTFVIPNVEKVNAVNRRIEQADGDNRNNADRADSSADNSDDFRNLCIPDSLGTEILSAFSYIPDTAHGLSGFLDSDRPPGDRGLPPFFQGAAPLTLLSFSAQRCRCDRRW